MIKFMRFLRNAVSRDIDRRYYAAKLFGDFLTGNFRVAWRHCDWWRDEAFTDYLTRFNELHIFNTQRRWTLWQLIRMTGSVPGDTAECGVYYGASSWLIAAFARQSATQPKAHHLFDSFEGLSDPGTADGSHWRPGVLAVSEEVVLRNLAPFEDLLHFHKGWIPDRFADVADRIFSFVHIDVDLYEPTRDSVAFFYDRLSPGGILLCDDYGCTTCPGATKALDEFLKDRPEKMISLDAGGGFFIKGVPVQAEAQLLLEGAERVPAPAH
jgi:O-methyltransferase